MSERREHTRFKTLGLTTTPYGEVMDISDSGMGVFRKGRVICAVGDDVTMVLGHGTEEIELNARVVRVSNVGLFRHEIGFEFVGITEETLSKIWSLTDTACSEFAGPRCYLAA
ncbi:MAG: PilZ domain-containing protein [Phycisphaeraceae bacterium]